MTTGSGGRAPRLLNAARTVKRFLNEHRCCSCGIYWTLGDLAPFEEVFGYYTNQLDGLYCIDAMACYRRAFMGMFEADYQPTYFPVFA